MVIRISITFLRFYVKCIIDFDGLLNFALLLVFFLFLEVHDEQYIIIYNNIMKTINTNWSVFQSHAVVKVLLWCDDELLPQKNICFYFTHHVNLSFILYCLILFFFYVLNKYRMFFKCHKEYKFMNIMIL